VLSYDTDGTGNPDDCIVGPTLADVDAAVAQAATTGGGADRQAPGGRDRYLRMAGNPRTNKRAVELRPVAERWDGILAANGMCSPIRRSVPFGL
jgi:hypothetical protein